MYQNRITLTPNEILEKEFKIDTRGYRLKEVDQFLDIVIHDYDEFISIINQEEKEKETLMQEIQRLKQELRNVKASIDIAKSGNEVTNVDLLRRISKLENIVYKNEVSHEDDKIEKLEDDNLLTNDILEGDNL